MAEVGSDNGQLQAPVQLNREISGAAAEVETEPGLNASREFFDLFRGEFPPLAIDGDRKEVVQEIVAVRDLAKHLPDRLAFRTAVGGDWQFFTGGLCFHRSGPSPFLEPIPAERRW